MKTMLSLILMYLLHNIHGHSDTDASNLELRNDADLQAELIPQELNTQFVSSKEPEISPWRGLIPAGTRPRRDAHEESIDTHLQNVAQVGVMEKLKMYSRIASCVALVVAALIEIVLYIIEFYK